MKTFPSISTRLVLASIFVCLWQSESLAALFGEEPQPLNRLIYVVIAAAAVIGIIAIFNDNFLTRILGRLGHSSERERGPKPGEGAAIHHSSGEADFGGSPEKVPPRSKDADRDPCIPPHKSAD